MLNRFSSFFGLGDERTKLLDEQTIELDISDLAGMSYAEIRKKISGYGGIALTFSNDACDVEGDLGWHFIKLISPLFQVISSNTQINKLSFVDIDFPEVLSSVAVISKFNGLAKQLPKSIRELQINRCSLGRLDSTTTVEILCSMPQNVKKLVLQTNGIDQLGRTEVTNIIEYFTHAEELDLSGNSLGLWKTSDLITFLESASKIYRSISLDVNGFTGSVPGSPTKKLRDFSAIFRALEKFKTVSFQNNRLEDVLKPVELKALGKKINGGAFAELLLQGSNLGPNIDNRKVDLKPK